MESEEGRKKLNEVHDHVSQNIETLKDLPEKLLHTKKKITEATSVEELKKISYGLLFSLNESLKALYNANSMIKKSSEKSIKKGIRGGRNNGKEEE